MLNYHHTGSIVIAFVVFVSRPQLTTCESSVDTTGSCRQISALGVENEKIPDRNFWATSHSSSARDARLSQVKDNGAWTASVMKFTEYLGVDLESQHLVTGVATQGKQDSQEYITEYFLEYSPDNTTWTVLSNQNGSPKTFKGNSDDNGIQYQTLKHPIYARYVRFNPRRWHNKISLRVEIYGCKYDAGSVNFDGMSRISYDVSNQTLQSKSDQLMLRFRSNMANGLIFYADSSQGDMIGLELVAGKLYFHIGLGATLTTNTLSTIKMGGLLDDGQWHNVHIKREGKLVTLTLDHMNATGLIKSSFNQLDLDRNIHLGGVDNFFQVNKEVKTRSNFTGCMENVWFNGFNLIKGDDRYRRLAAVHTDAAPCQVDEVVMILHRNSRIMLSLPPATSLALSIDFRSINKEELLYSNKFSPSGGITIKLNSNGYLEYSILTHTNHPVENVIRNDAGEEDVFTDGHWHSIKLHMQSSQVNGKANFTVDGMSYITKYPLQFSSSTRHYVGKSDEQNSGFTGCVRNLEINNQRITTLSNDNSVGVTNGPCLLQNRCIPNPCLHGGICSLEYNSFACECSKTGYEGAVCHSSKYLRSCADARLLHPTLPEKLMTIDLDRSGPLPPIKVNCVFQHDIDTEITEVPPENMGPTLVDGFQEPGSYVSRIVYEADIDNIDEIIGRSLDCEQYVKYECSQSRLLSDAGRPDHVKSWGWWVGRRNRAEHYWGGTPQGSGKCSCGMENTCQDHFPTCNCDSMHNSPTFDDGYLRYKEDLPVMEVHFGDTGDLEDRKWGKYTIGPLRCRGDVAFNNVVSFLKEDAAFLLPTFVMDVAGDISFMFKTTQEEGILLQNTGPNHLIEVKIYYYGLRIGFRFVDDSGAHQLEITPPYPVSDNAWHRVYIEINTKEVMLKIDSESPVTLDRYEHQRYVQPLQLTSPLFIGQ